MTQMSMTTVIDFAALDQIRAKARIERSKAFWEIWAAARTAVAARFVGTVAVHHLATQARA